MRLHLLVMDVLLNPGLFVCACRYLTYKVNFNALLLFELQHLVKEAQIYESVS